MEFISGLLWGAGLSLGICVGLVAWIFLKTASYRLLGLEEIWDENRKFSLDSLDALLYRNVLTKKTNAILTRIANINEHGSRWYEDETSPDADPAVDN